MGTWGDGLYDNDSALDTLWTFVKIDGAEQDAARLVARIGLLAWLNPGSVYAGDDNDLQTRVDALTGLDQLPEPTRAALRDLLADPEAVTKVGARTPAASKVIGGYSDGPRIDALLRFPGAAPVIDELIEQVTQRLDRSLAAKADLYEVAGSLAALAVLIELKQADLWQPDPARVARWRAGFDTIDQATTSERSFWWKYVRRVRGGFDLLIPAPPKPPAAKKPATTKPVRRKPKPAPAPTGPIERFSHPKFGAGTLLARSRTGDADTLELRFDDGTTRKVLARFVTAIDD